MSVTVLCRKQKWANIANSSLLFRGSYERERDSVKVVAWVWYISSSLRVSFSEQGGAFRSILKHLTYSSLLKSWKRYWIMAMSGIFTHIKITSWKSQFSWPFPKVDEAWISHIFQCYASNTSFKTLVSCCSFYMKEIINLHTSESRYTKHSCTHRQADKKGENIHDFHIMYIAG